MTRTATAEGTERRGRRRALAVEPPAFVDVTDVDAATANLTVYQPSFAALVKDTVLIRVSVSCERGRLPLSITMLGLAGAPAEVHTFCADFVRLGNMTLLDPVLYKQLQSKEERMRQILREYGIQTPWGGCAVPKRLYLECTARLDEIKAEIEQIFQRMLDTYDEWVEDLVNSFRTWALVKFGIETGAKPELMGEPYFGAQTGAPGSGASVREEQVEKFVRFIRSRVPRREQMQRKFKCEWVASRISNPRALLAGEDLERLEQEKLELERTIAGINTDAARTEAQMRLRAVEQDLAVERDMHARSREAIERLYTEEIGTVLKEASAQIRDEIYTVATEVVQVITKGGAVQQRNLDRLQRLVDYAQGIALGDGDAMKLLQPIRDVIAMGPQDVAVGVAEVRSALDDVAAVARAEVYSLSRRPRLEAKVNEADIPVLDIRRARQVRAALGIEADAFTPPVIEERRGGRRRAV